MRTHSLRAGAGLLLLAAASFTFTACDKFDFGPSTGGKGAKAGCHAPKDSTSTGSGTGAS